jgi:glutamate--cysteine ligase
MPDPERRLDEGLLLRDLQERAFAPTSGPPTVGLEVELLAFRGIQAVPVDDFLDACAPLIRLGELVETTAPDSPRSFNYGSIRLTFEPGGQLELISPPRSSASTALEDVQKLEMLLDRVLSWRGIRRACHGVNPWQDEREIELQTPQPRYLAMQTYFNQLGPDGVRMMRLTCSLQVNLDTGRGDAVARRWRLANLMSPILVGMFANSPMSGGRLTGWKSSRAAIWLGVDPSRTGFFRGPTSDGPHDYLDFALDGGVLLRRIGGEYRPGRRGATFRQWMRDGDEHGFPTLEDWHYHLTTLFPQVRPRGFFELRAIDTPPVRWRAVPVALTTALLIDERAREASITCLEEHLADLDKLMVASAQHGPAHPTVGLLAERLMGIALDALPRLPEGWITPSIASEVHAFHSLYTERRRCPADELLDLQASGQDVASLAWGSGDDREPGRPGGPW